MRRAVIAEIEYALPAGAISNEDLARSFPEWGAEKIAAKTGISVRHIANADELSSDLAARAAELIFAREQGVRSEVDFVLFCTQTPDYVLPTSACLLQHRLRISTRAGALDFNLGCSGYIYGLSLAKGLIESGQASCILLLTGETYSKLMDPADKTVRTIFGDAGSATLVRASAEDGAEEGIRSIVFGTDGAGANNLICHGRRFRSAPGSTEWLKMNGPEIFNFTLKVVPAVVEDLLRKERVEKQDVDFFVFHQANQYMMDHLRKKLHVPEEKFVVALSGFGNTVSSTIPIALCETVRGARMKTGSRVVLVGFGVGYSWGAAFVIWK